MPRPAPITEADIKDMQARAKAAPKGRRMERHRQLVDLMKNALRQDIRQMKASRKASKGRASA